MSVAEMIEQEVNDLLDRTSMRTLDCILAREAFTRIAEAAAREAAKIIKEWSIDDYFTPDEIVSLVLGSKENGK